MNSTGPLLSSPIFFAPFSGFVNTWTPRPSSSTNSPGISAFGAKDIPPIFCNVLLDPPLRFIGLNGQLGLFASDIQPSIGVVMCNHPSTISVTMNSTGPLLSSPIFFAPFSGFVNTWTPRPSSSTNSPGISAYGASDIPPVFRNISAPLQMETLVSAMSPSATINGSIMSAPGSQGPPSASSSGSATCNANGAKWREELQPIRFRYSGTLVSWTFKKFCMHSPSLFSDIAIPMPKFDGPNAPARNEFGLLSTMTYAKGQSFLSSAIFLSHSKYLLLALFWSQASPRALPDATGNISTITSVSEGLGIASRNSFVLAKSDSVSSFSQIFILPFATILLHDGLDSIWESSTTVRLSASRKPLESKKADSIIFDFCSITILPP